MELRFHLDPETRQPHIYDHGVTEEEVHQVFLARGDEFEGRPGTRVRFGQTEAGRYLKVVFLAEEERDSVFVITAYDLTGNALKAFRRRQRRKKR